MSKQTETHDVKQFSEIPGIMSCLMTHKAISTNCDFKWLGPKLNAEWPKILAFFKWTYDTTHSESQVRLYVNSRTKEWKAWAFPQKAKMGMNANEITEGEEGYERSKEQRVQFSDAEGWTYWGTVHHHCATSAFQSGTDQQNERSQEGLHITVGNLNTNQYDIHFRVYKSGFRLTSVKLSEFWDIGPVLETVPEMMRSFLNGDWVEKIAHKQMGTPCPNAEFPEIWRENVIDVTPKAVVISSSPSPSIHGFQQTYGGYHPKPFTERSSPNLDWDVKRAMEQLDKLLNHPQCTIGRMDFALDMLEKMHQDWDDDMMNLADVCFKNDVTPANLYEAIVRRSLEEQKKHQEELAQANGNGKKRNRRQGQPPHWSDQHFPGYGAGAMEHMGD